MNYFWGFLSNFTLTDSVDIAIVAFIIYRFLLIVQGTRAVQILLGLVAVGTLYWLSLSYELYSLNWILKHFFDYFFIIMIILFQDQIRSGLASFGEARPFFRGRNNDNSLKIEEVVTAATALSREKTGALIVFERDSGLLNYSLSGTRLDCRLHSDIIYSIFQSSSPLHDGAVIILDNRIQSAGCFLPLSKNVEIDSHMGTRHRAALGVTEVSDAVVLVVSEETGKIHLCAKGKFFFVETEELLRKGLRRMLMSDNNDFRDDFIEVRRSS